ncbi:TonB-dependent receptor [Siccirubricoccus phaeus]|uniref:TonB-dependent receptor n=1 Tax=Siccirubricoccus phaeus TaxID=2595053 RepID=UPI00165C5F81|nr:TonB-dependent receptor [Siccirubricoccus phaeus]
MTGPGGGPDASPVQAETPGIALPELVVTGTKRAQDPMRVNGTLEAVEAEDLAARNLRSIDSLQRIFPDLTVQPRSGRIYSNVTMRGQTSSDFYNPSVQLLVDGLPQDFSLFGQLLPVQVERVEALYGPQGTLYGAGAVGGVLNVVTRRPDDTFRIGGSASYSSRQRDTGVLLNTPIVPGALYADLSLNWREQFGNYRAPQGDDAFGGTRDIGVQGRLRYAPAGSPWDIMVTALHNVVHSAEEQFVLGDAGMRSRRVVPFDSHYRLRTDSYGLIASYDLGGAVVSALTGYQDRDLDRTIQGFHTPETQRSFNQELRIASTRGALRSLDYVAGLYFQNLDFTRRVPRSLQTSSQTIRSYAGYGELTWHVTDRLDLTAGLRVDRIETEAKAEGFINFRQNRDDTAVTPKVAVGYQITEGLRAFALYSTGFKPGGFTRTVSALNASFAYGTANTDNFEIGLRGLLDEGRYEFSISGYYSYTDGYQAFVGAQPSQYLQNVGDVRSYGLDARVTARPFPGARITGALGLNDAHYARYRDPTGQGQDFKNNRPAYAPPVTASAEASYAIDLPGTAGQLIPFVALTYVGRTWFDEANTVGQGSYTLVDAGLSWVLNPNLRADFYANNLGDKRYATYGFSGGPLGNFYQLGTGRDVGLRLTANF